MPGGYVSLAVVALMTTVGSLLWPARTAGLLLSCGPIIWAFGAADWRSKEPASTSVVAAVSMAATLMYVRFLLQQQRNLLVWLQRAAIVYCLAVLPSFFVSPSFKAAGGCARQISPVVFMFAVLHCSRPRGVSAFHFRAIALSSVGMVATVLLAQYTGDGSYLMGGFERLRAFNLSPQHVSEYSVAVVSALICGMLGGKHRYVYMAAIVALIACTYLTGFRTAWIGMAVLIGLVMIFAVRSGLAKFIALLIALSTLGASGIIMQSMARYTHGDEAVSVDSLDTITSGRITTDTLALNRYVAGTPVEWLFGIGVYSSEEATYEGEGVAYGVHNDFLATLIECGVVGLLSYLFLVVMIGWTLLRAMRYLPQQHAARTFVAVGLASLIAFTIMGISGSLYNNVFVGWYYYGFIGFALAQAKIANVRSAQVFSPGYRTETALLSTEGSAYQASLC